MWDTRGLRHNGLPAVRGDRCGIVIGGGGVFAIKHLGAVGIMIGMLPGMLFCVCRECVRFINFNFTSA
jgi:hypothetical protein